MLPDDGLVRPKHVRVSVTQSTQAINEIYLDVNLHLILYRQYIGK
jgi:hypothetical protein